MKKRLILIISITLSIVTLTVIFVNLKPKQYFHYITYDEIDSLVAKNDNLTLLIGREECPYCEVLVEQINEDINKYKKDVYYYEMGYDDILKKEEIMEKYGDFEYVPHIIYFKNGEIDKITKSEEDKDIYENFWNN